MWFQRITLSFFMVFGLAACELTPRETRDTSSLAAIQQELSQARDESPSPVVPPANVSDALLPPMMTGSAIVSPQTERFDVLVNNVNARDFYMGLVKDTSYNMVVHPDVAGDISLELRNVTIDEVMEVVREVYGYSYKKRGMLFQILPGGIQSEVFQIDYLSLKRRGMSEMQVRAGQISDSGSSSTGSSSDDDNDSDTGSSGGGSGVVGSRVSTTTDADFWQELKDTLKVLVGSGEGREVVVTPQAGIVVVRAMPEDIELVRDYLRRAELIMRRQVVLEAKILEVKLSDGYQTGIDWAAIDVSGSGHSIAYGVSGSSPVSPDGIGGIFGLALDAGDFTGVLELLETQGSVQVLSSPRISTVNNQKAVIKVGQDEFFVTEVSNTTTVSSGTTTSNPEIELTPFFSGIALDVTPQISDNNEIILHIHPSISEVNDQVKTIDFGGSSIELPLALSTIRETDSVVFARSGQVIVLGGLMQNKSTDSNSGTPVLGNLPLIGHLFSQQRNSSEKSELVILLKPVIIDPDTMQSYLDSSRLRFDQFRKVLEPSYNAVQ